MVAIIVLAVIGVMYYMGQNSSFSSNNFIKDFFPQENQIVNNTQQDCLPTTNPWIKVLSPNGGETYTTDQPFIVKWTSCNVPSFPPRIVVTLHKNGEKQNNIIYLSSATMNDGDETFTILAVAQGSYKIGVGGDSGTLKQDFSDNLFTINSNNSNNVLRKKNETCGENIGNCEAGLKCAYPCGIPGCQYKCLPKDELNRP